MCKRFVLGAALAVALASPASADTLASAANAAAVLQVADCYTTQQFMRYPGTFERNPLARAVGANRSMLLCAASAGVINFALRKLDRTHDALLTRSFATLEAGAVGNNLHLLFKIGWKL